MADNNVGSAIIIINSRTVKWMDSDKFFVVTESGIRDVELLVAEKLIKQFPAKLIYTDKKTIYVYKYDVPD